MPYDCDLFVIGGGPGGVRAARLAAQLGKRVAIAEKSRFGGTCVIRGCVPKKLFFYASQYSEHFKDSAGFGWRVDHISFDWKALVSAKDKEIARLEEIYRNMLSQAGVDLLEDRAVLVDAHTVRLENVNLTVTAERIVIATGSLPIRMESMPGYQFCITSDEVFSLEKLPQSILLVGGSYIAVEFANIFNGLGVDTTIINRSSKILSCFDIDMSHDLTEAMRAKGIHILNEDKVNIILRDGENLKAKTQSGKDILVDQVMLAIGRKPNAANLGLEAIGIKMNSGSAICTDAYSRTNIESIFAFGDVTDRIQLAPVAIHEANCFVETEFKGNPSPPDYDLVPTAVFSQPEIACVGITEQEAVKVFSSLEIYRKKFRPRRIALSGRLEYTTMKLIVNSTNRKVLGVHILGYVASEIIQMISICLKAGCSKDDFDRCVALHPTAAEELVVMYSPAYCIRDGQRVPC